jgi:hypothetical protein
LRLRASEPLLRGLIFCAGTIAGSVLKFPVLHLWSIARAREQAEAHTALAISADQTTFEVTASREADLVLFLVDGQAPFSRAGTMSG